MPSSASTAAAARRSAADGVAVSARCGVRPITAMSRAVNGKAVEVLCGT